MNVPLKADNILAFVLVNCVCFIPLSLFGLLRNIIFISNFCASIRVEVKFVPVHVMGGGGGVNRCGATK
jgi:hypothetical protein